MESEKVVIIIPTYNEAAVIKKTLLSIFQTTASISKMNIHVLVFDSNSVDNTPDIVRTLQKEYPQLHLQTEPSKSGLGSAYWQAMHYALHQLLADIVIEFDADLSHQPEDIIPILDKINTYDVVIGSRYVPGGSIPADWGWYRKLISKGGNYIARLLITKRYHDFTSGFRATRSAALLQSLPDKFLSDHYAYKIHLFWLLYNNNLRIYEHPITFINRTLGKSKLPANSIFDTLRVLLLLRFYGRK